LAQRTEARRDAEWLCIKKARSTVLGLQGPKLDRYGVRKSINPRGQARVSMPGVRPSA
jgi:hypothetical protein